jgi:capsular exopolysaccharide synthesis family protein
MPAALVPAAAVPPAAPADDETAPSSGSGAAIFRALRRRWALALGLGLLCMAAAAAATWRLVPVRHTARTTLRIDSHQPVLLAGTLEARANSTNYQRTQLAMVKSRLVLNAALRQPKVGQLPTLQGQANPVEWLEKEIKADYSLAPEILRISLVGERPQDLALLVDAVRMAYLQEVVEKEKHERGLQLERLKTLYAEYDDLLRDKRRNFSDLARAVGSRDSQTLAHKHKFALERLSQAQKELWQLQSELRKARIEAAGHEAEQQALAKGAAVPVAAAAVEAELKKEPQVVKAEAEIARLEGFVDYIRGITTRGDQDPAVQKLKTKLDGARAALAERREALRPRIEASLREKTRLELQASATLLRRRLGLLKEMAEVLGADVQRMEKDTNVISKGSVEIESLREDLSQAEDMAKKLGTQMEALKVELRAPSRVSVLEEAVVSSADGEKRRLMATAGAGAGGLGLVLFAVVWWELRARRIGTLKDVKHGLGMALVGTLPRLPTKARKRAAGRPGARRSPDLQLFLESVDATRTVLLHKAQAESLRTVMITSAVPGEGKTSLASFLSASLARAGCRTLLVDGDLRNPSLHKLLGLSQGPGLSEALRQEVTLADAIRPTAVGGLSLLSAGHCDEAALCGLVQDGGRGLFNALRDEYDFVIVDSAPVLPVADSLLIGRYVDAVLFSLLRDVSRTPDVLEACERLSMLGVRLLGAVVCGMHAAAYGRRSGYTSAAAK